jgi:hypothetical protein
MRPSAAVPARRPRSGTASKAPRATPASKISVTVDAGLLREVRKLIRGTGGSLSAHVTHALERDLRLRRMAALVEAYEADHGAISDAELAEIRAAWQG